MYVPLNLVIMNMDVKPLYRLIDCFSLSFGATNRAQTFAHRCTADRKEEREREKRGVGLDTFAHRVE